nr:hypothetical protein HK105_000622 [Polyrhizophydium stewartii]
MGYVIPSHYLKFCKDPNLPNELLAMEERQVIRSYKFGVEYAAAGQTTEEQALSNTHANNTGTHSVYTKWQGYEVMYHVSTLLPHKPEDKQQLERKRHIGNDIVVIIFQDGKDVFDLSSISSHQNHVVAMVCPDGDGYRVQFAGKVGVPPFTPDIPDPPLIQSDPVSRDFFLHKLVNAERASYKAPSFAPKLSRTRSVLLYDIAVKFLG